MKADLLRFLRYGAYGLLAYFLVSQLMRHNSGPDVGSVAASFDLPVVGGNGARFRLDEHRGRPVLIEVFASWCAACRRAAPALRGSWDLRRHEVTFVGVSVDGSAEDAAAIRQQWQIPYDVVLDDGSVSRSYKVRMLPTLVLLDRDGKVRRVSTGTPSKSELESWLSAL